MSIDPASQQARSTGGGTPGGGAPGDTGGGAFGDSGGGASSGSGGGSSVGGSSGAVTAEIADDLAAFVRSSPTSFHAAAEVRRRLTGTGFEELEENRAWHLRAGGKYLVVRDGAVIAWIMPASAGASDGAGASDAVPGFAVLGAHTDSPALKLKPNPGFSVEGSVQVGVEIYGGPLLNSWLDRELAFAGRLITRDGEHVLARTGPIGRIPQLAIHLDRQVNEGLKLDKQRHMQPVIGLADMLAPSAAAGSGLGTGSAAGTPTRAGADAATIAVFEALAASAGIAASDIVGFDVLTIADQAPARFGLHGEFLASPRLDNLVSVHAGATALAMIDEAPSGMIPMLAAFDHEEVGSGSRSGASGPFLADVTERIFAGDRERYLRAIAQSFCLSADTGHAAHPNYPERHDPVTRPRLGHGPMLKINAQQRYASDGPGAARFAALCRAADVHGQEFVSNNAMPCGSTIGPLTTTRLGMTTADIGIALWSMHSAREMCAISDVADLVALTRAFFAGARSGSA